jgi:hypothetical protein
MQQEQEQKLENQSESLEVTDGSVAAKVERRSDPSGHGNEVETRPPVASNAGPYRSFTNLTVPLLQSNVLNVVQKKTGVLKSSSTIDVQREPSHSTSAIPAESIQPPVALSMNSGRVVPKLNRPSSILSQIQSGSSLVERALSIASSGKRSIDSFGNVDSQLDKRPKDSQLQVLNEDSKEDLTISIQEHVLESKPMEPVKATSKAFQSLADIRKGLALKKKAPARPSMNNGKNEISVELKLDSGSSMEVPPTLRNEEIVPIVPMVAKNAESATEGTPVPFTSNSHPRESVHMTKEEPKMTSELGDGEIPQSDLIEEQQPSGMLLSDVEDGEVMDESIQLSAPSISNVDTATDISTKSSGVQETASNQMDDTPKETTLNEDDVVPSNIYKGSQTSFLTKETKPISFLHGHGAEKPKPTIKALEQAQLAAKKVFYSDDRNKKSERNDKK